MDPFEFKDQGKAAANELDEIAHQAHQEREKCAKNRLFVETILTHQLKFIRQTKHNVGYDMALLMLMEPGFMPEDEREELVGYNEEWKMAEARYKGLEGIMDALKTKISFYQSVAKYEQV